MSANENGGTLSLRISLVHQFEQQKAETWGARFSLDGYRLVSSDGNALYLWQLNESESWDYKRSLPFRNAATPCFTPNGNMLAFGGREEFIQLLSLDGREVTTFSCPSLAYWAFSPDQRWMVSSDTGRDILLWDLVTFQCSPLPIPFPPFDRWGTGLDLSDETVGSFLFTPDSQRLVFGVSSYEGYVHVCHFDPEHRRIMRQKTLPVDGILTSAITPNGKILAILDVNREVEPYETKIYVYDLESFQLLHIFPQKDEDCYCLLAFSPDSHCLASCKDNGVVDIFSLDSFDCIAQFAAHPGLSSHATEPIGGLDWSRTGFIVTGGASFFEYDRKKKDYTIKLWKGEYE